MESLLKCLHTDLLGLTPSELQHGGSRLKGIRDIQEGTELSSIRMRVQERDNGLCPLFCLGESCPPALTLMPDTSGPPCMLLVPFKLLPWCWSSEGVSLSKSVYGLFKRICLGPEQFLPPTQSPLVFADRSYGDLSYWNPGQGDLVLDWDS